MSSNLRPLKKLEGWPQFSPIQGSIILSSTICPMSSFQFDRVVFDHRVGEQFLAHRLDFFARLRRVALVDLDLDQLALADLADAGKAQCGEGVADRLGLRVEHPGLEAD